MNLLLRFLRVVLHGFFRSKIGIFDDSEVHFHVWPNDLDLNMHMTNSRYLSVTDLARIDRIVRQGIFTHLIKRKLATVLGASYIRFRQSLNMFQRYTIKTRLIGIDEKWFYIEHRFTSKGKLVAFSIVKGLFIENGKSIPTLEAIKHFYPDHEMPKKLPKLPKYVAQWIEMEDTVRYTINKEYKND